MHIQYVCLCTPLQKSVLSVVGFVVFFLVALHCNFSHLNIVAFISLHFTWLASHLRFAIYTIHHHLDTHRTTRGNYLLLLPSFELIRKFFFFHYSVFQFYFIFTFLSKTGEYNIHWFFARIRKGCKRYLFVMHSLLFCLLERIEESNMKTKQNKKKKEIVEK